MVKRVKITKQKFQRVKVETVKSIRRADGSILHKDLLKCFN